MKFLDWFHPHEGKFIIHAPLKACIRYLESYPEQVSWDAFYKGYSIKNRQHIEPNKYSYMLLFSGFRGMPFSNYLAKLNVDLEAVDNNTTEAKCIAEISTNLVIICVVAIMAGLILSVLFFPLIFFFAGVFFCVQVFSQALS